MITEALSVLMPDRMCLLIVSFTLIATYRFVHNVSKPNSTYEKKTSSHSYTTPCFTKIGSRIFCVESEGSVL